MKCLARCIISLGARRQVSIGCKWSSFVWLVCIWPSLNHVLHQHRHAWATCGGKQHKKARYPSGAQLPVITSGDYQRCPLFSIWVGLGLFFFGINPVFLLSMSWSPSWEWFRTSDSFSRPCRSSWVMYKKKTERREMLLLFVAPGLPREEAPFPALGGA